MILPVLEFDANMLKYSGYLLGPLLKSYNKDVFDIVWSRSDFLKAEREWRCIFFKKKPLNLKPTIQH